MFVTSNLSFLNVCRTDMKSKFPEFLAQALSIAQKGNELFKVSFYILSIIT